MKIRNNTSITLPNHCLPVPKTKKKYHDNLILLWSVLFAGSLFVKIILIVAICVGAFFIYHKKPKRPTRNFNAMEVNLPCFTYQELVEATDGFKEELGKGAFGVVYKGTIEMGSTVPVAIKKLNSLFQDYERERAQD